MSEESFPQNLTGVHRSAKSQLKNEAQRRKGTKKIETDCAVYTKENLAKKNQTLRVGNTKIGGRVTGSL